LLSSLGGSYFGFVLAFRTGARLIAVVLAGSCFHKSSGFSCSLKYKPQ